MSDTHGAVWWTELNTRDIDKALAYYKATLGWDFDTMKLDNGEDYHIAMLDGRAIAGLLDISNSEFHKGMAAHWCSYFAVDDVDAIMRTTVAAGGSVRRAPFDVPGIGRIAILVDPSGAVMGMMTPSGDTG